MLIAPDVIQKLLPIYTHKGRNIALYGGRGSGKSTAVADLAIMRSFERGFRGLCTREIQNSIKDSVKKLLEDRIEYYKLQDYFYITKDGIKNTKSGGEFIFCGLRDPGKIKSYEGITFCWVEEAQTITANSMRVLTPTIRKAGSQLIWTFNPLFITDPVWERFSGDRIRPDDLVIKVNYYDNPWFVSTALVEEMAWDKAHDYDLFRHVWLGECVISTDSQVMHGCWSVGDVPEPPSGTNYYHGADWSYGGNDPTACVRCWVSGKTLYIDRGISKKKLSFDDTPDFLRTIDTVAANWQVVADGGLPGMIEHCRIHGINVVGAKKGPGSIADGIQHMRGFNIVIHPDLRWLHEEFSLYSYKKDPKTEQITPDPIDKYNHGIDAIRYALESLRRGKMTVGTYVGGY